MTPRAVIEVELPLDESAEAAAAAIAILSPLGAERMAEIVDDLYDKRVRRVIELVRERAWRTSGWQVREAELVATMADLPVALVQSWIDGCPIYTDDRGAVRARIRDAAKRRREVMALIERLEEVAA